MVSVDGCSPAPSDALVALRCARSVRSRESFYVLAALQIDECGVVVSGELAPLGARASVLLDARSSRRLEKAAR